MMGDGVGSPTARRFIDSRAGEILAHAPPPRSAFFLDRDGVINVNHGYVHTSGNTDWVPGIFDLCRQASADGYLLVVITNQAGIARGLYSEAQFLDYTAWVHDEFRKQDAPILATYYCPHHPTAGSGDLTVACTCRKPLPGMILAATAGFQIDPGRSLLLGDKPSDIAAGVAAGVSVNALLGGLQPMPLRDGMVFAPAHATLAALQDFLGRASGGYNPGSKSIGGLSDGDDAK